LEWADRGQICKANAKRSEYSMNRSVPMCSLAAFRSLRTHRCRDRQQPYQAHQVVGGPDEVGRQLRLHHASKARASKAAHRFHPAEDLLDPLALSLAHGLAGMAVVRASSPGVCRPALRSNAGLAGVSKNPGMKRSIVSCPLSEPAPKPEQLKVRLEDCPVDGVDVGTLNVFESVLWNL
jgi:hypothetical protein